MPLIQTVLAAGISPFAANAISGSFPTSVTCAGTTQATATLLSTANNYLSTVSASGAGAQVPACDPGSSMDIWNGGANSAHLYGQTGESIGAGAANAAFVLAANKGVRLMKVNSTKWGQNLSA